MEPPVVGQAGALEGEHTTSGAPPGCADLPDHLSGPLDPAKMELTPDELEWALQVKAAIQADPELDNGMFSDMMIAQISLIDNKSIHDDVNLGMAMDRAHRLQIFRQECDILDTYADAKRRLVNYIRMVPGHFLHYCQRSNQSILVLDLTKLPPQIFLTHLTEVMAGGYYVHHALNLNLDAIRQGNIVILECQGFKWKHPEMLTPEVFRLALKEIWNVYPHQFMESRFCNTGVFMNLLVSMGRKTVSAQIQDTIKLGIVTDVRLDEICLVPTPEAAMERIERSMCEALRRRYEAEKSFKLKVPQEYTDEEYDLEAVQDPAAN